MQNLKGLACCCPVSAVVPAFLRTAAPGSQSLFLSLTGFLLQLGGVIGHLNSRRYAVYTDYKIDYKHEIPSPLPAAFQVSSQERGAYGAFQFLYRPGGTGAACDLRKACPCNRPARKRGWGVGGDPAGPGGPRAHKIK
jgi:hypothetical protein